MEATKETFKVLSHKENGNQNDPPQLIRIAKNKKSNDNTQWQECGER